MVISILVNFSQFNNFVGVDHDNFVDDDDDDDYFNDDDDDEPEST